MADFTPVRFGGRGESERREAARSDRRRFEIARDLARPEEEKTLDS